VSLICICLVIHPLKKFLKPVRNKAEYLLKSSQIDLVRSNTTALMLRSLTPCRTYNYVCLFILFATHRRILKFQAKHSCQKKLTNNTEFSVVNRLRSPRERQLNNFVEEGPISLILNVSGDTKSSPCLNYVIYFNIICCAIKLVVNVRASFYSISVVFKVELIILGDGFRPLFS
jgi:hypothetical protein